MGILAIEYDEDTKKLMSDVKKADALSGARGNSFMQQAAARGLQSAGENGGGTGMAFMGMGANAAGNMMNGFAQENTPSSYNPGFANKESNTQNKEGEDATAKLLKMKNLNKVDNFVRRNNGQSSSTMSGANNRAIKGKFH